MLGVSLPFDWLISDEGMPDSVEDVLSALKAEDVRSIELRTVFAHHSPDDVRQVSEMLWNKGFIISIHAAIHTQESAVTDIFLPLKKLWKDFRQQTVNITIHAINGDNVEMLAKIADYIEQNELPVTIALENSRRLPDKSEGDSASQVLEAVKAINRKPVGICWDMGHYMYWRLKNCPDNPEGIPAKDFIKRVVHTHIHALDEYETHFPLDTHYLPLRQFLQGLSFEYYGLYNIELEYRRFKDIRDFIPALIGSVRELKKNLPLCAVIYDDIRDNFDSRFNSALTALDANSATKFGLIRSSSYIFNSNGYCWGMDVTFGNSYDLADTPEKSAELLKDLRLMVISHNHSDHFEEKTVRTLAKTEIEWVIPDFMYNTALSFGISPNKIHTARNGKKITAGKLTILPFESRHFRPGTNNGTEEYGYLITAEGSPSLVFPVDVRDFSLDGLPNIPKADYCFANVWLGDGNCLESDFEPIDRAFSEFMLKFSDKNIILTHLYESGRQEKYMWQNLHAEAVRSKIAEISPDTKVMIPTQGQVLELK